MLIGPCACGRPASCHRARDLSKRFSATRSLGSRHEHTQQTNGGPFSGTVPRAWPRLDKLLKAAAFRATRSRTARRAVDRGWASAVDEKLIVPTTMRLIEHHSSPGLLMSWRRYRRTRPRCPRPVLQSYGPPSRRGANARHPSPVRTRLVYRGEARRAKDGGPEFTHTVATSPPRGSARLGDEENGQRTWSKPVGRSHPVTPRRSSTPGQPERSGHPR